MSTSTQPTVNSSAQEYRKDYTKLAVDGVAVIEIEIDAELRAPIYMYYELSNFYQNHRLFIDSRSDEQLADPSRVIAAADPPVDCEPAVRNGDAEVIAWQPDLKYKFKNLIPDESAVAVE
ncbi:hypothetical protein Pmar_PMAR020312, partial [Perkinsus marinus ATCC 50983]